MMTLILIVIVVLIFIAMVIATIRLCKLIKSTNELAANLPEEEIEQIAQESDALDSES